MNKVTLMSILIAAFVYNSCTKESLVGINSDNVSKGSLTLKINESSIPPGIQVITAVLSRLNFDSLKNNTGISGDSLNVVSFKSVPTGEWHLNVDAINSESKILYNGKTDVTVVENETINIYLTLSPFKSGIGNIKIYIDWNNLNSWNDYPGNPVFSPLDNFSPYGVTSPKVLVDGSEIKMWYRQQDASGHSTIGYAFKRRY
jgi:hypothetical protein